MKEKIKKMLDKIETPLIEKRQKDKLYEQVKKLEAYLHPKIMDCHYRLSRTDLTPENRELL